jgi:hypothetical protein
MILPFTLDASLAERTIYLAQYLGFLLELYLFSGDRDLLTAGVRGLYDSTAYHHILLFLIFVA